MFTFAGVVSVQNHRAKSDLDLPNLECTNFCLFLSLFYTAYAFGATVKAELLDLVQEHGKMTFEESEAYLRGLMDEGRFSADLAD
mmetsp:Transcript_14422/g.34917  ORF Transcript_14422/g.34917 Transcript_14422/m.34917 type:complete len:85 (-) Transcript_14422:132-386(-)